MYLYSGANCLVEAGAASAKKAITYLQYERLFSESSGAGTIVKTGLQKTAQSLPLLPEQCLGAPQQRTFLFVCKNLVVECEFPLDASARASLWKTCAFSEYFLLIRIYAGKLLHKRMQSEAKLEAPMLNQWINQASGWAPVMLRCLSQMSLSCEWNCTSYWVGAYSETSMCGLFLGRSFSALFLSFQCSCFQQLSGLNHLFTISCESHPHIVSECGLWACSSQQEPPPSFPHASTGLAPASVSYSLPLTIRNKPWAGFAQLLLWTPGPTCSCQEGGEGAFLPTAQKHEWVTMTGTVTKGDEWNSLSVVRLFHVLKEEELWTLKGQGRGAEGCPECFETSH